jgi:transcriptional regulator with XRE-family HTH domain
MERPKTRRWFLREWRNHRGYTQDRLAEMTGLSKPFISQLERGERGFTPATLELLAEALKCGIDDLFVRDPTDPEGIWSVWENLPPAKRVQLVEIGKTLGRTGTNDE